AHAARGARLREAYGHGGNVLSLQLRGEYLFAAQGKGGLRIYDVAQIDHKGFSQRISTAPVSALGQKLYVKTKDATSVALPTTQTVDAGRAVRPENQEQKVHPIYDYAFVTDREEGLIVVGPLHTLLDGDPRNNFVHHAATFNEGGALTGAPAVQEPRDLAVQFRYAFVVDAEGLKVLDVTAPREPRAVDGAAVPIPDARSVYLARTYAYVAAGRTGLAIVDVERPTRP